jgi:hypothetical protein
LAICKNEPNDKPTSDGKGYIHILDNSNGQGKKASKAVQTATPDIPKADADRLDEVYTAFLKCLELKNHHFKNLVNRRGLTQQQLTENLYKSVPSYNNRFEVAQRLSESFDLEGIPGFYFKDGRWVLHLTYPGFYVPYRDEQGRIVGLQIRQDKDGQQKYRWLSSRDEERGTSSGAPLHFVNPETVRKTKEIFVTEGALKADIISQLHNVGVMAMGGVNVLKADILVATIEKTFPDIEQVVLAFDMDWDTNEYVREALLKLLEALASESTLGVKAIIWDKKDGKGLDDVLWKANQTEVNVNDLTRYVSARKYQDSLLACESKPEETKEAETKEVTEKTVIEENKSEERNMNVKEETYTNTEAGTFGVICRDFLEMSLPNPERVMFGLGRGNIGLMIASTNIGKTTLALNLSLSVAGNKDFSPLFNENYKARRVMYIDGEATKAELQADVRKMLESCSPEEQEFIKDNLCFICDEEINGEPLDLANPEHLKDVMERAIEFKSDLIIVDTLAALITMEDENDNAKVKKEVIQPLEKLGRKANAGVLLLHHTGKFIEGSPQAEDAYKGRGASAFGASSRVVFNLKKIKNSTKVILSNSKFKGEKFEPVEMELDKNSRWFKMTDNKVAQDDSTSKNYEQVVGIIRGFYEKEVKRANIMKTLKEKGIEISESTLTRILEVAVTKADITKPRNSYYSAPVNPQTEIPLAE